MKETQRSLVRVSRRKLFTWGLAAGGATLLGANEVWPRIHSFIVGSLRTEELPLLSEDQIPDHSIVFGVSPNENNFAEALKIEEALGTKIGVINYFPNSDGTFSQDFINRGKQVIADRKLLMYSWKPYVPEDLYYVPLKKFSVLYERQLHQGAQQLRALNEIVFLRPLCEMNGGEEWSDLNAANPDYRDWVDFWRNLYKIYQDEGATNVQFMFSPVTTINTRPIEPYYPGDDVVDTIALNIYGRESVFWMNPRRFGIPKLSVPELIGPDLVTMDMLAPDKDFWVGEVNSQRERGRAEQVKEIIEYVVTHKRKTRGIISFELNRTGEGNMLQDLFHYSEQDWQMLSDPSMVEMYKELLRKPWFNTSDPYQVLKH